MKKHNLSLLVVSCLVVLGVPELSFAAVCGAGAFNSTFPTEAKARQATTVPSQTGEIYATSAKREKEIADTAKDMEEEILGTAKYVGKGDTPPIEFFARDGVGMKYLKHADGLNHEVTRIVVSNMGTSDVLEGTLLAPVSGHTQDINDITAWSKSDVYDITTDVSTDKDGNAWGGSSYGRSPTEQFLIQKQKSQGIITSQELKITLSKNHAVRVLYYRLGVNSSLGAPGGYFDGRVIEFVRDGT